MSGSTTHTCREVLDEESIMRARKSFVHSEIDCGNLAYSGAAEGYYLRRSKLDKVQEKAVSLLRKPGPTVLPSALENRRE
mmetsp:Transcript_45232/g.78255  ORF Transcript_45232/g.78255 Transcript_45232/m.78255 type:complete len:80 (-) Transcript_45232:296-535(-)